MRTFAHGDVHLQIQQLTDEIAKKPDDVDLYLRRSDLYQLHQSWDAALADLERVRTLSPDLPFLPIALGRFYLESGLPQTALVILDRFLKDHPDHAEAHLLKARSLIQAEQPIEAAKAYDKAIALTVRPGPEVYIERARALGAAGTNHIEEAVRGLDQGRAALGNLVTLELLAIDLELERQRYDAALERLDRIAAQSPRKESWLKRRGDILAEAGRKEEAQQAYQAAWDAFQQLPPVRRSVPAMQSLEKELQGLLGKKE